MDFSDSTKVVYNRIQKLEPENASKIIGYLLLQDHGDREMIRLAFSPDNLIQSLINKAKAELGLSSKQSVPTPISPPQANSVPVSDLPLQFTPFSPASSRPYSSPATLRASNSYWDHPLTADPQSAHNLDYVLQGFPESVADDFRFQNQVQYLNLDDQMDSVNSSGSDFGCHYYYPEHTLTARSRGRSPSLPEFPVKVCHYFNKGFCKHGNSCRYFHGHPVQESFSQILSSSSNELGDDHPFSPGSLEKLELELTELLRSRRGLPVSIASLPMLYYEKYGRNLQAEGYLTESQRHGKAGYSLTKLLARLKNSIRLIDRPHGQHSVILAEDVPKYLEYVSERNEHGGIVAGSRQIYLTFPAESTFTEADVSEYFKYVIIRIITYGPVQDVRIPCQQKRMFGFVTFAFPETVKTILTKGNPHFVCGARVLVKPYREKSRLVDRKYLEKIQHPVYCGQHFIDMDEFQSSELKMHTFLSTTDFARLSIDLLIFSSAVPMPRVCDNSRLLRKKLMEEHEQALELERRRLMELQIATKPLGHLSYLGYSMDELKFSEAARAEQTDFPSAERYSYLLDVLNSGSTSKEHAGFMANTYDDQDSSQALNLPESPFASPTPIGSSISTVI
ncbi:OST-HTH/LOTUS domain [Dillenia turbinata]|uniref:OST-HTH/LOTUS domain n=1 Tax=Dillenia turbinata TaxID=194707 RepID=A0AAN8UX48_9MAGN